MASLANRNLALSLRALVERDEKLAGAVEAEDCQLDELEVTIDELVIQPYGHSRPGGDRLPLSLLVASKISSNLERIADQAVAIARPLARIEQGAPAQAADRYTAHGANGRGHVTRRHHRADRSQAELAQEIIKRDKKSTRSITTGARADQLHAGGSLHHHAGAEVLTIVARCLERVADHCKNIAEEVYYLYQAVVYSPRPARAAPGQALAAERFPRS